LLRERLPDDDAGGSGRQAACRAARVGFRRADEPGNTVEVVVSTPTAVLSTFAPPVFGTTNQGFAFDQPVLGFVDAGSTVTVFISTNGSFNQAASDFVVSGYLIDCTVNQCAPIAP